MSKHLVKILSIICFVALIPVIVVAISLCVTETVKYKVDVALKCETNKNASVKVLINDKETQSGKFQKNEEVTITFAPIGYELQGVYFGDGTTDIEESDLIAKTLSYTFKINKDTELVGVFNNLKLKVDYTGVMEDATTDVKDRVPALADPFTYKYGDDLYDLTDDKINADSAAGFNGWLVVDGKNDILYKKAEFNKSGDYNLKAVWSNQMQVTFFAADGTTPICDSYLYTKQEYIDNGSKITMLTGEDEEVKNSLTKGYAFDGWKDNLGNPVNIENPNVPFAENQKVKIILKEKIIDYKLNVKKTSFDDTTAVMTFDVSKGFGAYSATRNFYSFNGLKFNDLVYTYAPPATENEKADYVNISNDESKTVTKLSNVITGQDLTALTVEAVWICEYPQINFVITAMTNDNKLVHALTDGSTEDKVLGDSLLGKTHFYNLTQDEAAFKLEDNPTNEFYGQYDNPTSFFKVNINGEETERVDVSLSKIKIFYNESQGIDVNPKDFTTYTVAYCMNTVLSEIPTYNFSTEALKLTFIYE